MTVRSACRKLGWKAQLQIVVTVTCSIILIWVVDWSILGRVLRESPGPATGALLLFTMAQILGGVRLHVLARANHIKLGWRRAQLLTLAGGFLSNILPSTIGGDALRALGIQGQDNRWPQVIGCLIIDRAINIIAVAVIFAVLLIIRKDVLATLTVAPQWSLSSILVLAVILLGIGLTSWMAYRQPAVLRAALLALPRVDATGVLSLATAFGVSVCAIWAVIVGQWMLAQALGINIMIWDMGLIVGLVYFTLLIPFTMNGIGVQEVGFVALLAQVGIDSGRAIAFAAMVRMILILSTTPGLVALVRVMPKKRSSFQEPG